MGLRPPIPPSARMVLRYRHFQRDNGDSAHAAPKQSIDPSPSMPRQVFHRGTTLLCSSDPLQHEEDPGHGRGPHPQYREAPTLWINATPVPGFRKSSRNHRG